MAVLKKINNPLKTPTKERKSVRSVIETIVINGTVDIIVTFSPIDLKI